LFGEMVRVDANGAPQALLIAERFVPNQGDAWQWTLDRVRRGIHAPALTATDDEAGRETIAAYQPFARVIGKRLAGGRGRAQMGSRGPVRDGADRALPFNILNMRHVIASCS
jgi:maltose alpha-D-glucosyltransferase / alpha-amylase